MKRTPQEKKQLSLEKDHPLQAEYPHAFRKMWPRTKKKAQHAWRHQVKQILDHGKAQADMETAETDAKGTRRKMIQKWGSEPLGKVIQNKKERRIQCYRRKKNARMRRGEA